MIREAFIMKAGDLINLLAAYPEDAEVEIEIYETASGKYVDTTADITISERCSVVPILKIDADARKFIETL